MPATSSDAAAGLTIELARSVQITRTAIVHHLSNPEVTSIVTGCFVRVLLELESGREDYRVGYIRGTEHGTAYSGFTHDTTVQTTMYLILELPGELRGINGSQFQLNSISNSPINPGELADMLRSDVLPPISVLEEKAAFLKTLPAARSRSSTRQQPAAPQQAPQQPQSKVHSAGNFAASETTVVMPEPLGHTRRARHSEDRASPESDLPSDDQIHRVVMEELRDNYQVFLTKPDEMKTSLLRTTERDLLEYLDQVRESIRSNRPNCVVCYDRPPTIISLPCKHQVLCRLCATQVKCCPTCREIFVELFEPVEI